MVLLSLTLFLVIYQMINPGEIYLIGGLAEALPIAKAVLGGTVYSVLLGYVILRVLRFFYASDLGKMQDYLSALLFLLNMLFVAVISSQGIYEAIGSIKEMQVNNSGNVHLFGINYFFIGLGYIVENLPYALNIRIVFLAMSFLENFKIDRYSEGTIASAKKLSQTCGITLSLVVSSRIAFNILQLFFGSRLFNVNSSIHIPLFSIAFVFICLLLTRLAKENKALKDENDSII